MDKGYISFNDLDSAQEWCDNMNKLSTEQMARYVKMVTRDPLYFNKLKARIPAVSTNSALAGA